MKIILCTTFRDFKGIENDQIQYMFLDSIRDQTYQDFLVVVTTFGEKKVEGVVKDYFGEKCITRDAQLPSGYRFSLTDVVLNATSVIKELKEDCVVIWCTCDIKLPSDLFQKLAVNYKAGFAGIVHPNICYKTLEDMQEGINPDVHVAYGIDLLFFDGRLLIDAEQEIRDYRFYDWGFFEHFMAGIALLHSNCRINLFCETHVLKVANDRVLTNESKSYFKRCIEINRPVLAKYYSDKGISSKFYRRAGLFDIHCQYKMLNPTMEYIEMRKHYARRRIPLLIKIEVKYFLKQIIYGLGLK